MGLGLDRLVCWLLDIYNIRDSVMYPRAYGLLEPWNVIVFSFVGGIIFDIWYFIASNWYFIVEVDIL